MFNTTGFYDEVDQDSGELIREGTYPCFTTMQVLMGENGEYDFVVYQRASDLEKLEDDISFFEYVMCKISRKIGAPVSRLIIHYGSIHYTISAN